jgi:hypothetical protein
MSKYIFLLFIATANADGLYDSSPMNFDNSLINFDNSPTNFNNSPLNFENSPMNYNSSRIIRSNSGEAIGYGVPKENGGMNIYNLDGEREGYLYE